MKASNLSVSKVRQFLHTKPSYTKFTLYPSLTDIVEAMNNLFQEIHNHSENRITVKVSRRTQKVEIYLAIERSGLAFFSTDLWHIFGSDVGIEFGVMLRGKGPHKPEFAYDIVRKHSPMVYRDLIENNIVGNTHAQLLRYFTFTSKLKSGDVITTGQCMNYQTFNNLQFRPLPKILFVVFTLSWETRSVKNYPLYLSVSLLLF